MGGTANAHTLKVVKRPEKLAAIEKRRADRFRQAGSAIPDDMWRHGSNSEVMEALEFIHAKHYVHNDIKAQNLMTGFTTDTADRIFLLDFGLASKHRYQHIFFS